MVTICFVTLHSRYVNSRQGLKNAVSIPPKKETFSCLAHQPMSRAFSIFIYVILLAFSPVCTLFHEKYLTL